MGELVQINDKRGQRYRPGVALPSKQEMDSATIAHNVRNLAAASWWHAQGASQRGDHVNASRHFIARTRVLAEAQRQGLAVGV